MLIGRRTGLIAHGVAVLGTGATLMIRLSLVPWFGCHAGFMTFFPVVIIVAYLGGLAPGLLASVLGGLVGDYFFVEPRFSFAIANPGSAYALGMFLLLGAVISALMESLMRSRGRTAASECRYAVTLASIGDAIITTDSKARVMLLNPAAETLTGWPTAAAVGRPLKGIFGIFNEATHEPVEDPAAKVLRLGAAVGRADHTSLIARDGRVVPIEDSGAPVVDDRGVVTGAVVVFRDLTQRRRADEAEAFSLANQRLELALRGSNVGVWFNEMRDVDDRKGPRHYVNVWEQLGHDAPLAGGDDPVNVLHPDDLLRVEQAERRYLKSETAEYEIESRRRHKDGFYRTMLTRGVAVRDGDGQPIHFAGVTIDITRLKLAEEELRRTAQLFQAVADGTQDAVYVKDREGKHLMFNAAASRMVGKPADEVLGRDDTAIFDADGARLVIAHDRRVMASGIPDSDEKELTSGGVTRTYLASKAPYRDGQGKIIGIIGICHDITERKRAEKATRQANEELRLAKEAAEAANRAKDEFLAKVSHEIRTPLNAILGMTELALETSVLDDQRQYLQTVKSAADNLLGVINDLLDFAKIEAGKMELDEVDFSLRAEVGDTLRALAVQAHQKGLELICEVRPEVPDALIGDAGRLRQVLLNLVGNAIKFTDAGEVEIRVEVDGVLAPEMVGLQFTVRDTGVGIPRDKQQCIFRAFEQGNTSTSRKYGGTGLGLTIAAQLVALMGGQITVESEPRRGSTFGFTSRFGRRSDRSAPLVPVLRRDLRVLVVDDNDTNRRILKECLRDCQIAVAAAGDAPAAMRALVEAALTGRPYTLMLLDARMPDVDGLALAARVRERPELAATRIVLLTSGDRPGDWNRIRELQINAHLLKPVQQHELLETICRVTSGGVDARTARPAMDRGPSETAVPLRVLVAEDNELNAELMQDLLVRRGDQVRVARDGREALELALANDRQFDLMFLDIHMPELDGFEVVKSIREHERTTGNHLPIIALTARSRTEDRERCLAAGMDDFLAKPIQASRLSLVAERIASSHPRRADDPRPHDLDLIDKAVLLAACDRDDTILQMLCKALQHSLPTQLAAVEAALDDRDARYLREAAHKLCGTVATFSTATANVASAIEDRSWQDDCERARPLVRQLAAMSDDLIHRVAGLTVSTLQPRDQP